MRKQHYFVEYDPDKLHILQAVGDTFCFEDRIRLCSPISTIPNSIKLMKTRNIENDNVPRNETKVVSEQEATMEKLRNAAKRVVHISITSHTLIGQ